MLKVVIDTSVFVAGLLSKNPLSNPAQILFLWKKSAFTLIMSPQLLEELISTLVELGYDDAALTELIRSIGLTALQIPGAYVSYRLDDVDPKDNIVLAAALESAANFIVSLDQKSLLPMKHYHRTLIVTPELFMKKLHQ